MIDTVVESIIVGACHELRARPDGDLFKTSWNRAMALAVIEYHAERERKKALLGTVIGSGVVLLGVMGGHFLMCREKT